MKKVERILQKPINVIIFRIIQYVRLLYLDKSHGWKRVSKRANQCSSLGMKTALVFDQSINLSSEQKDILKSLSNRVLTSGFKIFNTDIPDLNTCDFSTDWRFNHRWKNQYYKKNNFYIDKTTPYDVKFPWELSRFHYLVPVLAEQVANEFSTSHTTWVLDFLTRWRKNNPLSYSVNWYPMEASIRTINLLFLLDFTTILQQLNPDNSEVIDELKTLIMTLLYEHGTFVWENREFTDIRGNHFFANITALLLAGYALENCGHIAKRWRMYALKQLPNEIQLQFYDDGVNFEKSCAYHKLVLELASIGAICCQKNGAPLPEECLETIHKAALFSEAITKPDHLGANFGDTDDAVGLPFEFDFPRCHGQVIETLRAWTNNDIGSHKFDASMSIAAAFLTGTRNKKIVGSPTSYSKHFESGGYVVVKNEKAGFFFIIDVGEVGMNGRGGHGHNDLLSFELCMNGDPVVIDPGCPCYTADLKTKRLYRSTGAHSTVQVDQQEMAAITGHWTISDTAKPINVNVKITPKETVVTAGHTGYSDHHPSGTEISRQTHIDSNSQRVVIKDTIKSKNHPARIDWVFPVKQAKVESINSNETELILDNGIVCFSSSEKKTEIIDASYSDGYGHEQEGKALHLCATSNKQQQSFSFEFRTGIR
ncbi:MAG: alginate lyase family protein [Ekhidna sp.]